MGKRVKGPGYRVCISTVSLLHTSAYVNLYEINLWSQSTWVTEMLSTCNIKVGSERKLLPIMTGRVTLNVAGCIQIVSFSFFFMDWCDYMKPLFTKISLSTGKVMSFVSSSAWWGLWNQPGPAVWAAEIRSSGEMPRCSSAQVHPQLQSSAWSGVLPWYENIPEGILAMLGLEHSPWRCHNGSLDCADTVVVRLGQEAEFLFCQKSYHSVVLFHAVLKN